MSVAALPMYDLPELQAANDALWAAIAHHLADAGIEAPGHLLRGPDLPTIWTDPALLLGQTCGYPLVTVLKFRVALLTTPCYGAPGCDGAWYRSAIVVRASDRATSLADLRGRRCAINDRSSNSGMNVLRAAIAPLAQPGAGFFGEVLMTGGHAASVAAVTQGRADMAAIDCVTWAHLQRLRPAETRLLRVLDWTVSTPGLPLITSPRTPAATRTALLAALADATRSSALATVRAALFLEDFVHEPLAAYDVILEHEQQAIAAGYPMLR